MRALIIDNEEKMRKGLIRQLELYCPQVDEIVTAAGVSTGLAEIHKSQPDIVFLDVEMDDGTGFDLVEKLGQFNFQLVFVTAHDKYALNAFKFSAVDFLLKPIDGEELQRSVERASKNMESLNLANQLSVLKESLDEMKTSDKKIVLRDSESIHFVKVGDIIRCEADGAYTKFILFGKKSIVVSYSLKEYEDMLLPYGFSRVHHSHIINLKRILRFDRKDGGSLVMENNDQVPISKRKKDELVNIIGQL